MKTLQIEVPDQLAEELSALIEAGWFMSESEIGRQALVEFIRTRRFQLEESFQRDDVRWARSLRDTSG